MSALTGYHPFTEGFDLAKEFFSPSKKDQTLYEPLDPDFGSILTALIRNGASFKSRGANKFDYVKYFVHFFLALTCVSHESGLKNELGLKNSFWYFDKENEQLKIFTNQALNDQKILTLKTVNFKPENHLQKHQWSDIDFKNIFFLMEKENLATYKINSHWYDVYVENLETSTIESLVVPSFVFTSDVKENLIINSKQVDSNTRKKFKKTFHKIDTNDKRAVETREILKDLASENQVTMAKSFDKLLDKIAKLHKKNLFGTLGAELQSLKSVFQCAFTHGALLALKKHLPVKIQVEQIDLSNPSYRILMTWMLRKSWKDVVTRWPMQVEFIAGLDRLGDRKETILDDVMTASLEMQAEMTAETFKDSTMLGYANFGADKIDRLILETKVVQPPKDILNYARRAAAITLQQGKIVDRLNGLKIFLDSAMSNTLSTHLPTYKFEKSRYISNYIHGYIASSDFLRESNGAAYKIEPKNPSDLEKQMLTSFMISTVDDSVDLILNIYEMDTFLPQNYAKIVDSSKVRKYPKTNEKVSSSVIYDFYLSFSSVKRKDFKSHVIPNSQCYMKSISKDGETTFNLEKIDHFDLIGKFSSYDGVSRDARKEDNKILQQIQEYFDTSFLRVKNKYELKAVLDGLLHKVKVIDNLVGLRKDVLQAAFMDQRIEKMNLLNFAYGKSHNVIEGLNDVKDLIDSNVLKDKESVKSINLAIFDELQSEKKTLASRNDFITVLTVCQRMSTMRSKRDPECIIDEEVKKFLPKTEEKLKPTKYLDNLSKLSSAVMFGLMAKDFISDLLHGNIAGVCMNAGFIVSNILATNFAQKLFAKGVALAQEDKLLLANILKIGGPLLQRLPSFAFVGFDLYNNILQYSNNQSEALVDIAADGGYMALDMAETVVEVAEAFGFIEGVSTIIGPIGWAVGAALLVGSDVYHSVRKVEHLNDVLHLTRMERITEGLRSFFGMDPEQHIQILENQNTELQHVIREHERFLLRHEAINMYTFPIKLDDNSDSTFIDLQYKRRFTKSRAIPDYKNYACLPSLQDENIEGVTEGYLCTNSLGLINKNRLGKIVYIQVGNGSALIHGHREYANVYDVIGKGVKTIRGTFEDDTVIIRSSYIFGAFIGFGGVNTVDISKLNFTGIVHFTRRQVLWGKKRGLVYTNVTTIIGRKDKAEKVVAWCHLGHIELQGGNDTDRIHIPQADCAYNMTILINGNNTWLSNNASNGIFNYVVTDINTLFLQSSTSENQTILFDYTLSDIKHVHVQFGPEYSMVHINFSKNAVVLLVIHNHVPPTIIFKDASTLFLKHKRAVFSITTSLLMDQAIILYSSWSTKSKIPLIIHSTTENVTGTLNVQEGTGIHAIDVALSSSTSYALKSMSHELIYVVENFTDSTIHVNPNQKVVIDLNSLSQSGKLVLHPLVSIFDVVIHISVLNQSKECQITLKNALKNHSYENIVVRKRSMYTLQKQGNDSMILAPIPLQFQKQQNLILLNSRDGLDIGSEVRFATNLSNFDLFDMKGVDLMLTNVLHTDTESDIIQDQFTLILKDFFTDEIMQSLRLVFENQQLDLDVDQSTLKPIDYLFAVLNSNMLVDV